MSLKGRTACCSGSRWLSRGRDKHQSPPPNLPPKLQTGTVPHDQLDQGPGSLRNLASGVEDPCNAQGTDRANWC